jgi:hypothetical protein
MTLFIHFGIYKAGSSYIQYICANQRDYLTKHNIFFPKSKQDSLMLAGKISRGNAYNLADSLKENNFKKAYKFLKKWRDEAEFNNCSNVLLSSEDLVHFLAKPKKMNQLIQCIKRAGYTKVEAMGFFRDIVDHAISTYKHRAKTGKHPDYKYWIENNYETPNLLVNLFDNIEKNKKSIRWNIRKFKKDSEYLENCFFKDWLEINTPKFKTLPSVNESVTLSEVKLLNHIKSTYPLVVDFFMQDLKALPKSDKAKDKQYDNYLAFIFQSKLENFRSHLDKINSHFREGENISLDVDSQTYAVKKEPEINLNDKQLSVIFKNISFFNTFHGRIIILRRRAVFSVKKNAKYFNNRSRTQHN